MNYVKHFSQINKTDVSAAGGKGASLGEMAQAGVPVPPGFVVLSDAFETFLVRTNLNKKIEILLSTIDKQNTQTTEHTSGKIRDLIMGAEIPEDIVDVVYKSYKELNSHYVAVRSSATAEDGEDHAWAGQLDSFLNTTEKTLTENLKRCWASLFNPRAVFYRFEKELDKQKISVAVVVQAMIESEVAGVAFSINPMSQDKDHLVIEASFGLGEAVVSGLITPDNYIVNRETFSLSNSYIGTKKRALYRSIGGGCEWKKTPEEKASEQALTEPQILELSSLIISIEKHYGFPCDIEWALYKERFFILQSRPITTLS